MALNFPGPWQVRLFYTVKTRVHEARYNVDIAVEADPGDPFSDFVPRERDGDTVTNLATHVDNWVTAIKPMLNSGDGTIDRAELWKIVPDTFDGIYHSTYNIGVAGTSAIATQDAAQTVFTFRTQEGGIARFDFIDSILDQGPSVAYASLSTTPKAIVDLILSANNIWLARDTSYPISFLFMHPGQSERWFKKIYRPS